MDADVLRGAQGLADVRLVHRRDAAAARLQDEIAGTGAGLDQAVVFEQAAGLQRGGQADVMGPYQGPHGRHALGRGQDPRLDGAPIVVGQA
jgi:hypothetical protein